MFLSLGTYLSEYEGYQGKKIMLRKIAKKYSPSPIGLLSCFLLFGIEFSPLVLVFLRRSRYCPRHNHTCRRRTSRHTGNPLQGSLKWKKKKHYFP